MGIRRGRAAVLAVLAATVLAGCATGEPVSDGPTSTPPGSARPPFRTAPPTEAPSTPGPPITVPTARWDAIVADLTARGVLDDPELVTAEARRWNDGSLGCPTPGASYTQQIVDGARVVVRAAGRDWDYRFGTGDVPRLCESGRATGAGAVSAWS